MKWCRTPATHKKIHELNFVCLLQSMDKLVEEYQAKVKSIEMLDDDLKKVDIELSNAKSNNHYKTLELENQNAEKKSLIQKVNFWVLK